MLITHNAFELLATPGRITMLGEVDGNRMRRIDLDGRKPPEDPDLSLHGYSIGHAADKAYQAAEAHDLNSVTEVSDRLDGICASCHRHYGLE
jgi:hypothetical protein